MRDITPIPFFTDDIAINPHTTSTDMESHIGGSISVREFSEIVGQPVALGKTPNGELYMACGRYPNISFVEGPESVAGVKAA